MSSVYKYDKAYVIDIVRRSHICNWRQRSKSIVVYAHRIQLCVSLSSLSNNDLDVWLLDVINLPMPEQYENCRANVRSNLGMINIRPNADI